MTEYYFHGNDEDPRDEMLRAFIRAIGTIFSFMLIIVLIAMLTGCKTRMVVVETVRTDTTYITRHERDSIHEHDSTHVSEKQRGDTIFVEVERWRTKFVERLKHDTLFIARHDTVPRPYPVIQEVEKPLTWWQQTLQRTGLAALAVLLGCIVWMVIKLYIRKG